MNIETRQKVTSVLILVLVVAVTAGLFIFRDRIENLPAVGYPVIFVLSILANATLILPLPGVALASVLGANPSFSPPGVAIAVGLGAALGEMTGYLAGYSGSIVVKEREWYERVKTWMRKYGGVTVMVLAFIPNPLFDIAGITAGVLKMPVYKYLFWCAIGKILKMLMFAYAGSQMIRIFPWLLRWE